MLESVAGSWGVLALPSASRLFIMQRKSRAIRTCTFAANYAAVPTAQRPRGFMPIRRTAGIGVGITWLHLHAHLQHIPASTRRSLFHLGGPDESLHTTPERWGHSPVQATGTSAVPDPVNSRFPDTQTTSPLGAESQTVSTWQRKRRRLVPVAPAPADPTVAITASEADRGLQPKRHQPKKTGEAGSRAGSGAQANAGDGAATAATSGATAAAIPAGAGAAGTRAAATGLLAKGQMRSPAPRERMAAQAGQHIPPLAVPHTTAPTRPHTPADGTTSATTRGHEGRSEDLVLSTGPVYVFWDLDNKYPETLDYRGLMDSMRKVLHQYGKVVEVRAYANYHTLNFVPDIWQEAMLRTVEAARVEEELRCPLCGAKVRGPESKLRTHFRQLHQRQHEKQLAHKPAAKKYIQSDAFARYQKAAKGVLSAKRRGYGLEGILSGLNVKVRPVPQGPQKADVLLQGEAMELLKEAGQRGAKAASAASASATSTTTTTSAASTSSAAPSASTSTSTPPCGPPPPPSSSPPVLVLVSDDHGFESLLKLFSSAGWRTVTVSNTEFKNAKERIPWRSLVWH
ncbi:hypothetical protein VaNZ11_010339 [Volvox africanus]|uniref:C2H2-type domain-containing protein n=1 Tax=Volvox africanus TaxID=51714 RepID=A0ABQ5SA60_9CHLO|nr:hypothetical protein VaNZ11_010339 [Volvox africanus]